MESHLPAATASNSLCGDPTTSSTTSNTPLALATIPISKPTSTSVVPEATVASSARPMASAQQVQPLSQPRLPQFLQHHQLQPPYQHVTNQQHQPCLFTAQSPIQIQTHLRPQMANASETVLYPLASSGRGLLPAPRGLRSQLPQQTVTVANPGAYPSTPCPSMPVHPPPQHQHSRLFAPSDSTQSPHCSNLIRTPFLHLSQGHLPSVSNPASVRGLPINPQPQPKAVSSPCSAPDRNGHKEPKDKVTDGIFATVRDRKVRIPDGASIYALCRSWLRNGCPEKSQPHHGDVIKSLPKPSPVPVSESSSPKRKESDDETGADEDEKSVENSCANELLQLHIKRAKRVRARLREERLRRIARYKNRLALLLPPLVEQSRYDTSTGT